jgi:hypothetical protein
MKKALSTMSACASIISAALLIGGCIITPISAVEGTSMVSISLLIFICFVPICNFLSMMLPEDTDTHNEEAMDVIEYVPIYREPSIHKDELKNIQLIPESALADGMTIVGYHPGMVRTAMYYVHTSLPYADEDTTIQELYTNTRILQSHVLKDHIVTPTHRHVPHIVRKYVPVYYLNGRPIYRYSIHKTDIVDHELSMDIADTDTVHDSMPTHIGMHKQLLVDYVDHVYSIEEERIFSKNKAKHSMIYKDKPTYNKARHGRD